MSGTQLNQILSQLNVDLKKVKRIVFVSSIAGSMIVKPLLTLLIPSNFEEIKQLIEELKDKQVTGYIGHPTTVQLLNKLLNLNLQPNRSEYKLTEGDLLIMISLAQRSPTGQESNVSDINQLTFNIAVLLQSF